jgi:hypothetical protein
MRATAGARSPAAEDKEEPMTLRTSPATREPQIVVLHSWEPPLAEMLADPVVQAVMSVDGVRPAEVVTLMHEAKRRRETPGGNS